MFSFIFPFMYNTAQIARKMRAIFRKLIYSLLLCILFLLDEIVMLHKWMYHSWINSCRLKGSAARTSVILYSFLATIKSIPVILLDEI